MALDAAHAGDRFRVKLTLWELRLLDAATDQWKIELGKTGLDIPTWDDLKPYLKPDSRLARHGGRDILGHPYILAPEDEIPSVHPKTVAALSQAANDAKIEDDPYDFRRRRVPAIIQAARLGDVAWFGEALSKATSIDQPDTNGFTALHLAARMGHLEVARMFCAVHPDPLAAINKPSWPEAPGHTPLYAAFRHAEVFSLFVDYGIKAKPSLVRDAIEHPAVLKLLLARGLSPNATDEIGEPILVLAAYSNKESLRLLLEAGANVHVTGRKGETPLHEARQGNNADGDNLLRAAGAWE